MTSSLDLETCRQKDQLIPYLAAKAEKTVDAFLSDLGAFLRLHKREAIPDDAVFNKGTYHDLLLSMGLQGKVKNYVAHLKTQHLTVIDLYPIAFFLDATINVYTVAASGTSLALLSTINAGKATVLTVATVGGNLSLFLECDAASKGNQKARATLLDGIKKKSNADQVALRGNAVATGGQVALLTSDEIATLKKLHQGDSSLSQLDVLSALIARHAAEQRGAANVRSKADLLTEIHAKLAGKVEAVQA